MHPSQLTPERIGMTDYAMKDKDSGWVDLEMRTGDAAGTQKLERTCMFVLYGVGVLTMGATYARAPQINMSSLLTFSAHLRLMALVSLLIIVTIQKSVRGISLKSICMMTGRFVLRLSTTTWLRGYIPQDSTGDGLYQWLDVLSLLTCCGIIFQMVWALRDTWQDEEDTFPCRYPIFLSILLGVIVHPSLNMRPFFDTTWATGVYLDVASTFPQLWLAGKLGGRVDALSARYTIMNALSRAGDLLFWYLARAELAPDFDERIPATSWNYIGYTILSMQFFHLALCTDVVEGLVQKALAPKRE